MSCSAYVRHSPSLEEQWSRAFNLCVFLSFLFWLLLTYLRHVGNYYGTPKPPLDSPLVLPAAPLAQSSTAALQNHLPASTGAGPSLLLLAGAHPSSEGKRRRNRSNVEAMAAAQNDGDPDPNSGGGDSIHLNQRGNNAPSAMINNSGGSNNNMSIPSYREDGGGAMGGLSEAELGPLPQNWEKAYTERGEVYFIEYFYFYSFQIEECG